MQSTQERRQCCWHDADGTACQRMTTGVSRDYFGIPVCRDHAADLYFTFDDKIEHERVLNARERAVARLAIEEEVLREHMEQDGCDVLQYIEKESAARAEAEALRPPNYIYYMRCGAYVKIGRSHDPRARCGAIRNLGGVRAPEGLDLSQTILERVEEGPASLERFRHAQFAHLRVAGEWFESSKDLEDLMAMKDRPERIWGAPIRHEAMMDQAMDQSGSATAST